MPNNHVKDSLVVTRFAPSQRSYAGGELVLLVLSPSFADYPRQAASLGIFPEVAMAHPAVMVWAWGEQGYENVWREAWGWPGSLVIWEHDMAWSSPFDPIAELLACPERLCAFDYPLRYRPGVARNADGAEADTFADLAGHGLVKVAPSARNWPLKLAPGDWRDLDTRLGRFWYDEGVHYHVHRSDQLRHHHMMEDQSWLKTQRWID